MLTYRKFVKWDAARQAEALLREGIYLELSRETRRLAIELYALQGFYVEVYFDKKTEDPLFLKAFQHTRGLEPYLDSVPIESLFEIR